MRTLPRAEILLSSPVMEQEPAEIIRAGVICRAPDGSILMLKRTDDGSWAFPGGRIEEGETPEQCAYRETFEETGRRLGSVGKQLMRRIKDDGQGLCDFTTFISDVDAPFVPVLNSEHSAFAWVSPEETLMENRADSMAVADSAGRWGPRQRGA
jgi:8-oxo-dGTP pyrophosphatase MutT (NUDIX family)